jgi:hypothetical protein
LSHAGRRNCRWSVPNESISDDPSLTLDQAPVTKDLPIATEDTEDAEVQREPWKAVSTMAYQEGATFTKTGALRLPARNETRGLACSADDDRELTESSSECPSFL